MSRDAADARWRRRTAWNMFPMLVFPMRVSHRKSLSRFPTPTFILSRHVSDALIMSVRFSVGAFARCENEFPLEIRDGEFASMLVNLEEAEGTPGGSLFCCR